MSRKNKHAMKYKVNNAGFAKRWIIGVILVAVVALAGYLFWNKPSESSGPDTSKLVGSWLRTDGGYVLTLSDPEPEGLLKAAYFNPRPINVSHAEWRLKDGLSIFVELRDKNYPGSTYTLTYNPATDKLMGSYFQAVMKQYFAVEFKRTQ